MFYLRFFLKAVHLRTLTLIEEGNPKILGDDPEVLSFARMVMYTECIASLHLGDPALTDYGFEPILEIQNHLQNVGFFCFLLFCFHLFCYFFC